MYYQLSSFNVNNLTRKFSKRKMAAECAKSVITALNETQKKQTRLFGKVNILCGATNSQCQLIDTPRAVTSHVMESYCCGQRNGKHSHIY